MAYPRTRSMNADLSEGMTDGKYKKVHPNRGGVIEGSTDETRRDLFDQHYGFHEAPVKVAPDGLHH